jgi:hypothetical protein
MGTYADGAVRAVGVLCCAVGDAFDAAPPLPLYYTSSTQPRIERKGAVAEVWHIAYPSTVNCY